MRHTPGPWHESKVEPGVIFADEGRMRIEQGGSALYQIARVNHGYKEDEDIANARLIAAAPELLAALKACAEFWRNGTPVHFGSDVVTDALEAIDRAEGN